MNEDAIFTVAGHEYSAGRLDAKRQFHVMRRITPFLEGVIKEGGAESSFDKTIGSILTLAGSMPDEQLDYILNNCLSVVKRRDGDIWVPISTPLQNGERVLQYKDIDMVAMLTIAGRVLMGNLSGFFDALPSDFTEKFKGTASAT